MKLLETVQDEFIYRPIGGGAPTAEETAAQEAAQEAAEAAIAAREAKTEEELAAEAAAKEPLKLAAGVGVPKEWEGKSVTEIASLVDTMKGQLAAMTHALTTLESPAPKAVPAPAKPELTLEQIKEQFQEDPIGAMNQLFDARIAPLVQEFQSTQARNAQREIVGRPHYNEVKEIKSKVDTFMATLPANLQAAPETWDFAYKKAIGEFVLEGGELPKKTEKPPAAMPDGTVNQTTTPKGKLSAEEKAIAQKMGLAEADYLKWRH